MTVSDMTRVRSIEQTCAQIHRDRVLANRVRWGVLLFMGACVVSAGVWLVHEVCR